MTPESRRAHLILHGQTLLDAWQDRAKLYAEGRKLYADAAAAEGYKLRAESRKLWTDAVAAEGCTMTWDGDTCTLSNGERYEPIKEKDDEYTTEKR